jgi:dTDP-4-dehydrorhamnose reductase
MEVDYLVVGSDGQVGRALFTRLRQGSHTVAGTTRRHQTRAGQIYLNLSDPPERWRLPERCAVTFLMAAETSLMLCDARPNETRVTNVERTVALARMMKERNSHLVFISTNLVLSGLSPNARSNEPLSPQCEYGRQKADVERQLLATNGGATILRITKIAESLVSLAGGWALQLRQGHPIRPFSDLVCAPISLAALVEALVKVADIRIPGLLQIGANLDLRYDEIATKLAHLLSVPAHLVQPTTSAQAGFALPANPKHTTLDTSRAEALLGFIPHDPWSAVTKVLMSLARQSTPSGLHGEAAEI